MNKYLTQTALNTSPKMNIEMLNGNLNHYVNMLPRLLSEFIISSLKELNSNIKVTYKGYNIITPEDEFYKTCFNTTSKSTNVKQYYDIASYDTYAVEYVFEYARHDIRKVMQMPFLRDGNLLRLSGTWYNVMPILSDTILSPNNVRVFVRLDKDKFKVEWKDYEIVIDDGYTKQYSKINLIYTIISRLKYSKESEDFNTLDTPIIAYLLGKYGLRETFSRFFHLREGEYNLLKDEHFQDEKYRIYRSTNKKKRYHKTWTKDNIHWFTVIVKKSAYERLKKDHNLHKQLDDFIGSMIYMVDAIYKSVDDLVETFTSKNVVDEIFKWRIVLGKISFKNTKTPEKVKTDMEETFRSLDRYVDESIVEKLQEAGIYGVGDFFQLLAYIFLHYQHLLKINIPYNSDSKHRYLDIKYYLLYEMKEAFNKHFIIEMNKRYLKKQNGTLSYNEVKQALNNGLKAKIIYNLIKSTREAGFNLCINSTSTYSDIKYLKVTGLLEDQSRGKGIHKAIAKFNKSKGIPDFAKYIRGDDLYLGSLLYINKSTISPRFKINTYLRYDRHTGKLIIPEDIEHTIVKINHMLEGAEARDDVEQLGVVEEVDRDSD